MARDTGIKKVVGTGRVGIVGGVGGGSSSARGGPISDDRKGGRGVFGN